MTSYQRTMLAKPTDCIHLQTLSADKEKIFENAIEDLDKKGFLAESETTV
ncbi:3H domain-containing protein [Staphylococcus simulans]